MHVCTYVCVLARPVFGVGPLRLCMCVYVYTCVCVCICVYACAFKVRHWPLSRGNKIWPDKLVLNPLRWSKPQPTKNKIVKKRTHAARAISTPAKKACAEKVDSPDVMIFDPKLGKLVCVLTDEAEEHDGGWESDA